jgi:hypothetical protein
MANATETGDRQLWPRILRRYGEHPDLRWVTLWHIRFYWKEHADLVVPLVRDALREPKLLDVAISAAAVFPEMADDLVLCVRESLRDPRRFDDVVSEATGQPVLTDVVVACLTETDLVPNAGSEQIIGALAQLLGQIQSASDFVSYARAVQQGILGRVRAELRQRYRMANLRCQGWVGRHAGGTPALPATTAASRYDQRTVSRSRVTSSVGGVAATSSAGARSRSMARCHSRQRYSFLTPRKMCSQGRVSS